MQKRTIFIFSSFYFLRILFPEIQCSQTKTHLQDQYREAFAQYKKKVPVREVLDYSSISDDQKKIFEELLNDFDKNPICQILAASIQRKLKILRAMNQNIVVEETKEHGISFLPPSIRNDTWKNIDMRGRRGAERPVLRIQINFSKFVDENGLQLFSQGRPQISNKKVFSEVGVVKGIWDERFVLIDKDLSNAYITLAHEMIHAYHFLCDVIDNNHYILYEDKPIAYYERKAAKYSTFKQKRDLTDSSWPNFTPVDQEDMSVEKKAQMLDDREDKLWEDEEEMLTVIGFNCLGTENLQHVVRASISELTIRLAHCVVNECTPQIRYAYHSIEDNPFRERKKVIDTIIESGIILYCALLQKEYPEKHLLNFSLGSATTATSYSRLDYHCQEIISRESSSLSFSKGTKIIPRSMQKKREEMTAKLAKKRH